MESYPHDGESTGKEHGQWRDISYHYNLSIRGAL